MLSLAVIHFEVIVGSDWLSSLIMIDSYVVIGIGAEPDASCTALSVQEGETASITFFFNGILNQSMKYFLSIRKDDGKGTVEASQPLQLLSFFWNTIVCIFTTTLIT